MLHAMSGKAQPAELVEDRLDLSLARDAAWLDLLSPTDEERSLVERVTGLRVPAETEISEIENSSRLVDENGVLTLSTPMVSRAADNTLTVRPVGFVLSCDRLITLRYGGSVVFDHVAAHWRLPEPAAQSGAGVQAFPHHPRSRGGQARRRAGAHGRRPRRRIIQRVPQRERAQPVIEAARRLPARHAGRYRPQGRTRLPIARRSARRRPHRPLRARNRRQMAAGRRGKKGSSFWNAT